MIKVSERWNLKLSLLKILILNYFRKIQITKLFIKLNRLVSTLSKWHPSKNSNPTDPPYLLLREFHFHRNTFTESRSTKRRQTGFRSNSSNNPIPCSRNGIAYYVNFPINSRFLRLCSPQPSTKSTRGEFHASSIIGLSSAPRTTAYPISLFPFFRGRVREIRINMAGSRIPSLDDYRLLVESFLKDTH